MSQFFSDQCWGKVLRPIAKPPTKDERERLNREGNKIKFADVRCEKRQALGLWKGRGK